MGNCAGKTKEKTDQEKHGKPRKGEPKAAAKSEGYKDKPIVTAIPDNDITYDGSTDKAETRLIVEPKHEKAPLADEEDLHLYRGPNDKESESSRISEKATFKEVVSLKNITVQMNGSNKPRVIQSATQNSTTRERAGGMATVTTAQTTRSQRVITVTGNGGKEKVEKNVGKKTSSVKVQHASPFNFGSHADHGYAGNFAKGRRTDNKKIYPQNTVPTSGKEVRHQSQIDQNLVDREQNGLPSGEFDGGSLLSDAGPESQAHPQSDVQTSRSRSEGQGNPITQPMSSGQGHSGQGQAGNNATPKMESKGIVADHTVYDQMEKRQQNSLRKLSRQEHVKSSDTEEECSSSDDSESDESDDGPTQTNIGYVGSLIIGQRGKIHDKRNQKGQKVILNPPGGKRSKSKPGKKDGEGKKGAKDKSGKERENGRSEKRTIAMAEHLIIGPDGEILDERDQSEQEVIVGKEDKDGKSKGRRKGARGKSKKSEEEDGIPRSKATVPIPISDQIEIVRVAKSVGIIKGKTTSGTAFRVGNDKIMTAYHVVKGIIYDELKKDLNPGKLGSSVIVDFDYTSEYVVKRSKRYRVAPKVLYSNEALDTAILQLQKNDSGNTFPPPIVDFGHFNREQHEKYDIYLVGHSGANIKEMDRIMKYWEAAEKRIEDLERWSYENHRQKYDPGDQITKKDRIMFECSFRQGASGSPGFIVHPDGKAQLITMLLRGFPDFYYHDFFSEKRADVDVKYLKQQGVNMGAVYSDLKGKDEALFREIFEQNTMYAMLPSGSSVTRHVSSQVVDENADNIPVSSSGTNLASLAEQEAATCTEEPSTSGEERSEEQSFTVQGVESRLNGDSECDVTVPNGDPDKDASKVWSQ